MPSMETPADTAPASGATFRARNTVPFALALAAVGAFSFLSGGYVLGRNTPVAVTLLCAAAAWVWFVRRSTRPPLLFLVALTVLAASVAWSGLSVLWSVGPDLTWVAFNLAAFYLAVVAVLGLTPARVLQLWTVAYGYLAVAAAVGVYAFLGKGLPAVVTHAHMYARLDSPVGYWNVLSLMMVMGLCVSAVAGDRRTHVALRTLGAAAAVPMCFTFFFTFSRGGWIVLAVTLILYFAFTTTRLASFVELVAVIVPVASALWRVRDLDTLYTETSDDALRTLQGDVLLRWAILALLAAAGVQLVAVLLQRGVRWPRWSVIAAGATVLAVVGVVVLGGSGRYVQTHGGAPWVKDRLHALFTDAEVGSGGNGPGRLLTLTTNGRIDLWREAARQSRYHRAAGTGAGTFPFTHYRFRASEGVVKHAHSQWFNVLSELGLAGLGLFVAAVVLLAAAAVRNPFTDRRDPLRPLLVALQAGVIAFVVHISWDWDWDMAAVGTLAFVFIAVCVSYRATRAADDRGAARADPVPPAPAEAGMPGHVGDAGPANQAEEPALSPPLRSRRSGWPVRAAAGMALVLLAASWLPPYLALRAENAALAASSDGRVPVALARARRAAALDPLAVSPLLKEASLLQQLGRNREALARLRTAAKLQPQNYEVWYELGSLLHGALGRDKAAQAALSRALALNPLDAGSRYELELVAR